MATTRKMTPGEIRRPPAGPGGGADPVRPGGCRASLADRSTGRSCLCLPEGAVVDGEVVGQARPGQAAAQRRAPPPRTRPSRNPRAASMRLERPPAMHDPNLETLAQERPVAPAPQCCARAARRAAPRRRRVRSRGPRAIDRRAAAAAAPARPDRGRRPGTPTSTRRPHRPSDRARRSAPVRSSRRA